MQKKTCSNGYEFNKTDRNLIKSRKPNNSNSHYKLSQCLICDGLCAFSRKVHTPALLI